MEGKPTVKPIKKATFALVSMLLFFVVCEIGLRVAFRLAWPPSRVETTPVAYLPRAMMESPDFAPLLTDLNNPWTQNRQLLADDMDLFWSLKPSKARLYIDITAAEAVRDDPRRRPATFAVRTNRQGFRGGDWRVEKPPGVFRIACVGDSYTFGFSVNDEETYPKRLAVHLGARFPSGRFEVLNFGVPGYSSYQGRKLLEGEVLGFAPDVVLIGFGSNDSASALRGQDDATYEASVARRLRCVTDRSELYRFYRFFLFKVGGGAFGAAAHSSRGGPVPHRPRVSPEAYAENLEAMAALAQKAGVTPILLNPYPLLFRTSPYVRRLEQVAAHRRIDRIDPYPRIADRQRALWAEAERRLGLASPPRPVEESPSFPLGAAPQRVFPAVFRLSFVSSPCPPAEDVTVLFRLIDVTGGIRPSPVMRLALTDRGRHGDEAAGDRVYSARANVRAGMILVYFFVNGGAEEVLDGAGGVKDVLSDLSYVRIRGGDVPALNAYLIAEPPELGPLFLPVHTFGRSSLFKDVGHFNGEGNEAIAQAIAAALGKDERLRAYLDGSGRSR